MLAIGAHPDDIEIGAGGLLLEPGRRQPGLRVRYVVLTGTPERQLEARGRGAGVPARRRAVRSTLLDLPEGRLPAAWGEVKEALEARGADPGRPT